MTTIVLVLHAAGKVQDFSGDFLLAGSQGYGGHGRKDEDSFHGAVLPNQRMNHRNCFLSGTARSRRFGKSRLPPPGQRPGPEVFRKFVFPW